MKKIFILVLLALLPFSVNAESKLTQILSSGSAFDFTEFRRKKGAVAQTLLTQVDIIIHHKEINNVNLLVRRSFSEHLSSWINDAASRL